MGYHVEELDSGPREVSELAAFLAAFVSDGEGASKDLAGREVATWQARLEWWWKDNPFCRADSPRGFLLRDDKGEITGFFGYIPHDAIENGKRVPGLISTTTFVRRESREAALGLFLRAHRLLDDYQIVDGGPNAEARALLLRTGYEDAGKARVFFYPIKRSSLRPHSLLLQGARAVTPRPNGGLDRGFIVSSLEEVTEVPEIRDARLRKWVDRETLEWYLNVGSERKAFVGWCDSDGVLRCYLIGQEKQKYGVELFLLVDALAFDRESESILNELIAHVSAHPDGAEIPSSADLIAWPTQVAADAFRSPLSLQVDSNLFYRLPKSHADADRLSFPFEGDQILL